MEEKIQPVIPACSCEMIGQKTASQDHACLEDTADRPGDDLSEDQTGAVHRGHKNLNGPVALFAGDGSRNHLAVEQHQEVEHKDQNISVPVVVGPVFSQNLHIRNTAVTQNFLHGSRVDALGLQLLLLPVVCINF